MKTTFLILASENDYIVRCETNISKPNFQIMTSSPKKNKCNLEYIQLLICTKYLVPNL